MKLESSHEKIEKIFEIMEGLDDLDKEAWVKLITDAEIERAKEKARQSKENIERCHEILDIVLPSVRLTRLILASQEVDSSMRVILVQALIKEFLWLLSPIETAGILWSEMYSIFEDSRRMIPMPVIIGSLGAQQSKDESRTVV